MYKIFVICFVTGIIQTLAMANHDFPAEPQQPEQPHQTQQPKSDHTIFGYDDNDPLGPKRWPEKFGKCAGKYQSPIDIEEQFVTKVALPPLILKGFDIQSKSATITNNGHTVMVKMNRSEPVTMSGGPLLNPSFELAQFHFHWGANDSLGSEDMINNHSYPMELHMVFYNSDYNNATTAQQYMDGLAVLAFFLEVTDEENEAYKGIVQSLSLIVNPGTEVPLQESIKLIDMLPKNLDNYFTYMGSLTTPPCNEGVRWIDFKHPIRLSHEQLNKFRTLHSEGGILSHNFRPIQPRFDRPIWYNNGSPTNVELDSQPKSSGFRNQINLFFCISLLFLSLHL